MIKRLYLKFCHLNRELCAAARARPHLFHCVLINFWWNSLEKSATPVGILLSRLWWQKSRLGWQPRCRWRRLFSIVYITQHPPPLIQHYHQPPHHLHSTLMYTIKYSMAATAHCIIASFCHMMAMHFTVICFNFWWNSLEKSATPIGILLSRLWWQNPDLGGSPGSDGGDCFL